MTCHPYIAAPDIKPLPTTRFPDASSRRTQPPSILLAGAYCSNMSQPVTVRETKEAEFANTIPIRNSLNLQGSAMVAPVGVGEKQRHMPLLSLRFIANFEPSDKFERIRIMQRRQFLCAFISRSPPLSASTVLS